MDISIRGPCFEPGVKGTCTFGNEFRTNATFDFEKSIAYCTFPSFKKLGKVDVELTINELNGTSNNYYGSNYVTTINNELQLTINSDKALAENIENITFHWDPALLGSIKVEIVLIEPDAQGQWKELAVVGQNLTNSGSVNLIITPQNSKPNELTLFMIRSETIERVKQKLTYFAGAGICLAYGLYTWEDGKAACDSWYDSDPGSPDDLEPCPPTVVLARADSRFVEDSRLLAYFHPGAAWGFRQRNPSPSGGGQQCVYKDNGEILIGPPGGGTADLHSPSFDFWGHQNNDVRSFCNCCVRSNDEARCRKYYEKRPSDAGTNYVEPGTGGGNGDPHIVTLDSYAYSFNGLGEFWMIKSNDLEFQARMEQFIDSSGVKTRATIFTAFAMKDSSTHIQCQLTQSGSIELFLNGELVSNLATSGSIVTDTADIQRVSLLELVISFKSGFTFRINSQENSLNILVLSGTQNHGKVLGLLGYFDGNQENDLKLPNGSQIPITSAPEQIYYDFGLHWATKSQESLFIYAEGLGHGDYFDPSFIPEFNEPDLETIPEEIKAMCQGSKACLFDYSITGEVGLANLTRIAQKVINDTKITFEEKVKMCSQIGNILNGYIVTDNYFLGSKAKFYCDSGYVLEGHSSTTCIQNGNGEMSWDNQIPKCQKINSGMSLRGTGVWINFAFIAVLSVYFLN